MSSKRRLRRKKCTGKVKHPTEAGAIIAARRSGPGLTPYKCRWCGSFHVGHTPRGVRWKMTLEKRAKQT